MTDDEQKLEWYRRRCKALEDLLVMYRISRPMSERLATELERTGKRIDHAGVWRAESEESK